MHATDSFLTYQMQLGRLLTLQIIPSYWLETLASTHVTNWNLWQWHLLKRDIDWWRHHFLSDISNIWKETSSMNLFAEGNFMTSCRICASLASSSFLYFELDKGYTALHLDIFYIFHIFYILYYSLIFTIKMRRKLWKKNTWELTNVKDSLKLKS